MRWITFLILLYLAAALQVSHLGTFAAGRFPRIEYLPLLALFYALYAEEGTALLVCWLCGLVYDLTDRGPLGANTAALAIIGLVVVQTRHVLFREHAGAQFGVVALGTFLFGLLSFGLQRLAGATSGVGPPPFAFSTVLWESSSSAFFTGVITPVLFLLLSRLRTILGFEVYRLR